MSDTTFFGWLSRQRDRSDPIGDLARDAVNDVAFPRGASSVAELQRHLSKRGASSEAIDSLRRAYVEWPR